MTLNTASPTRRGLYGLVVGGLLSATASVLIALPVANADPQCNQTVGQSIDSYLQRHPDLHQQLEAKSQAEGDGGNVMDYLNRHPDVRQHLIDLLEGLQYLAGCIAGCMHLAFDYDRDHPFLQSGTGPFTKMGLDNPDTLYFGTRVQAGREYVVTGRRGTTTDLSFQLLGGEYTDDNVPASQAAFDDRELDIAADGSFEWRVRPTSPGQLVIREVYGDWSAQRGTLTISRLDTAGTAPPPLTRQTIEKRYATAGKQLVKRVKTWLQFPQWFYLNIPVNTMVAPRLTPGGLATQYSSAGHFDLRPDQALVITIPVSDAPYLGFQLGSMWYISLDYINHQTSLNNTQAQADPDGKVRIVVADQNPGVTNWVETLGHRRGFLQFRWQRVSRGLTEADGPTVEIVDFDAIAGALPYFEHNKISDDQWRARIALRQQQIAARMLG